MIQRVSVRAIIKKNNRILLLRRSNGRPAVIGKYQLPGGRIEYGIDPERALEDYIFRTTGLTLELAHIHDVVSYVDPQNRNLHYIYLVFLVGVKDDKVQLSERYDHYMWRQKSDINVDEITIATQQIINLTQRVSPLLMQINNVDKKATINNYSVIYTDGGSRGNPGPSATGYIITNSRGQIIREGGMYIGITTNSVAEYTAVKHALYMAIELGLHYVDFRCDSTMVVEQMSNRQNNTNVELQEIQEEITRLLPQLKKVRFTHIRRSANHLADTHVNHVLDQRLIDKN